LWGTAAGIGARGGEELKLGEEEHEQMAEEFFD
jgi:hypothetical protein